MSEQPERWQPVEIVRYLCRARGWPIDAGTYPHWKIEAEEGHAYRLHLSLYRWPPGRWRREKPDRVEVIWDAWRFASFLKAVVLYRPLPALVVNPHGASPCAVQGALAGEFEDVLNDWRGASNQSLEW